MKRTIFVLLAVGILTCCNNSYAQIKGHQIEKIEVLEQEREKVIAEEKEALKQEVIQINKKFNKGEITQEEASDLKGKAAERHALNIENKIAIIDNKIALLERETDTNETDTNHDHDYEVVFFDEDESSLVVIHNNKKRRKYDKRTSSDLVVAFGLNNAIIEGQSIDDSPYKIGKSKFFEIGWAWKTRIFENSNVLRLKYGFSFTYNGLNPIDNLYFVDNEGQTSLELFHVSLTKSKLRMDNLVVPVHFEFGPSKKIDSENYIRYSEHHKFKFGIGGYAGFNLSTRQKLKYVDNGDKEKDKIKKNYNTNNFIYGLSAYIGADDFSLYVKYDLNTIFNDGTPDQNNISLGLRFDL